MILFFSMDFSKLCGSILFSYTKFVAISESEKKTTCVFMKRDFLFLKVGQIQICHFSLQKC